MSPFRLRRRWFRVRSYFERLDCRIAPAIVSLNSGILTIDFSAAGTTAESVTVTNDDTDMTLTGDITGDVSIPVASVTKIVVIDSGSSTNQTLTLVGSAAFSLDGGLSSTGVETVGVNNAITVGSGAIAITSGIITTSAAISTSGGSIALTAKNGVTLGGSISTSGGAVNISADANADGTGKLVLNAAMSTGGGAVSIRAADVDLNNTISSSSTVSFASEQAGRLIDFGTDAMDLVTLGLSSLELDRVTANTLKIGDANHGTITVTSDVKRSDESNVILTTGGEIHFVAGLNSNGGNITLTAAGAITQFGGVLETASTLIVNPGGGKAATFASLDNDVANLVIPSGITAIIDGSFVSTGAVQVDGTLAGHGSVGTVTVTNTGKITPGSSPGTLTADNIALNSGSVFQVEMNGALPGVQFDEIVVHGTVNLGGATLATSLGFAPTAGQVFTIIDNDGTMDAVTGTFNGLVEGATITIGAVDLTISYKGGDGNDVTLTRQTANTPPTVTSVTLSDGSGAAVTHRSQVRQIIVTFSEAVSFTVSVGSAFRVERTGNSILNGDPTGEVAIKVSPSGGPASVVTITFDSADTTFVENGSLKDGLYDFTINASQIIGAGGNLDGDGIGGAGGDYAVTGSIANKWYRLFGDDNGDGTVSQVDYNAFLLQYLGGPSNEFDFGGDGNVSQVDYNSFILRYLGAP